MDDKERDILQYVQNEKDISRYNIYRLEKRKSLDPTKRRLLEIEREFVKLPLEEMGFDDVADVAAAIRIYRDSRGQFYKTYNIKKESDILKQKVDFLSSVKNQMLTYRPQEINLIQDEIFLNELALIESEKSGSSFNEEAKRLGNMSIEELENIEPLSMAKKRARLQALVYSFGLYLQYELRHINNVDDADIVLANAPNKIFKYYNLALDKLPNLLSKTMGSNEYLSRLHKLKNVLDFNDLIKDAAELPRPTCDKSFNPHYPQVGNILFGYKKAICKSLDSDRGRDMKNKVYGILLPISRTGNEKMTLLHKSIYFDGNDVGRMFSESISNVKALNSNDEYQYYKAILTLPLWKMVSIAKEDDSCLNMLCSILAIDRDNFNLINFDDERMIKKINSNHTGFFDISDDSCVLVPQTRSEEVGICEAYSMMINRISKIEEEYFGVAYTTNDINLD
jgi:hypothetical protein